MSTRFLAAFLCLACLLTGDVGAQTSNGIKYIYDELGRLVGVVDLNGETATYAYDAVGNLLSVSRRSSGVISIIEFTPDGGGVGATVTIYGTSFSPTPGENTVKFNGTTAAVTASSPTHIVTSVPTGATTGSITVTTQAGTATSSSPFLVSDKTPVINSFTPTVGTPDTALTISGNNFEAISTRNKVRVNGFGSTVRAGTGTSITASIPNYGSGRVSVETPWGTAVSSGDVFIPPAPYTPADVEVTGRLSFSQSKAVTISAANRIGMQLFDGSAGLRVSLKVTNTASVSSKISILKPDGSTLTYITYNGTGGAFIDTQVLPATGTYTVVMDPESTLTGSLTFTLYDVPPDVTASITPGGPQVTLINTVHGQNGVATFNGTAGQKVSLKTSASMTKFPSGVSSGDFTVRKPDGTTLHGATALGNFMDAQTLPVTGAYTIFVNPTAGSTGSATLNLYDVIDVSGTITPGGTSLPVTISTPGQNASLTFNGNAGQSVSLKLTNSGFYANYSYYNPDGTILMAPTARGTGTGFVEPVTLPAAGTYTVLVNPSAEATGGVTLTLYDVPTDVTGTITADGSPVTITTTTPGQNGKLTFSGTAGRQISLKATGVTTTVFTVSILKPDGSALASRTISSSSTFIDATTLPASGTYTILFNPSEAYTGSATLNLYDVVHTTGTITPGGAPATASNSVPGQNNRMTFDGVAGQRVSLQMSSVSYAGGDGSTHNVSVDKPDGTSLVSGASFNSSGGFVDTLTLPVTGAYTITVNPSSSSTGSSVVTLYDVPPDASGATTIGAAAVSVTTTVPGQNAKLTFAGTSGQQVTVRVTNNTMNVEVRLLKPDGSYLNGNSSAAQSFNVNTTTLPATGTYTVSINPQGAATGSLSVSITNP